MEKYLESPTKNLEFRCIGIIKGKFQSSDPGGPFFFKGQLDINGEQFDTNIINKNLVKHLSNNPELLETEQYWTAFIKTAPVTRFQIKHLRDESAARPENSYFSIRGNLSYLNTKYKNFEIQIKRNVRVPQGKEREFKYKPFSIKINGELPPNAKEGQFWDIEAEFQNGKLVLSKATMIKEAHPNYRPRRPRGEFRGGGNRDNKFTPNNNRRPSNAPIKRRDMRSGS